MEPIKKEDYEGKSKEELTQELKERAIHLYESKEAEFPEPEQIREIERVVIRRVTDSHWMNHIDDMDQLRQGVGLQAYGQREGRGPEGCRRGAQNSQGHSHAS